eukprot:10869852-Karenia_brevis.AAC.1
MNHPCNRYLGGLSDKTDSSAVFATTATGGGHCPSSARACGERLSEPSWPRDSFVGDHSLDGEGFWGNIIIPERRQIDD